MGGLDRMIASQEREGIATGDQDADAYLRENPNAVLIGVLLDQQIRAEVAFSGPYRLYERLGHLDLRTIADMDPDAFKEVFGRKPAIHRFASMMADRVQTVARLVADEYDGDASKLWADAEDDAAVAQRAKQLPGFGASKAKTLVSALDLFGYRSRT
jgi:uncharacterized HhH-GPD family protein